MDRERIDLLCADIWNYVWSMLDVEIDLDTETAGVAATIAEFQTKEYLYGAQGLCLECGQPVYRHTSTCPDHDGG